MDSAKQQLIDKLKTANNILVTVSRNPSVDQLASCIGLTLLLNKQGKHAAAVFSGEVPSTIEFLQPEETLEKNTDSLRDFIIALDKSKADKLRYKVEDNIVRIFITPYKTSISEADLEFSEGDFNVDVVIALGVLQQEELDEAIVAHGRILHDATVTSINTAPDGGLGTINWYDPQASSLSELVTELTQALDDKLLDNQIATALLTGIVSETGRFSNDKTSSQTMSASAALMAAGANQQLVASKLEEGPLPQSSTQASTSDNGGQNVSSDSGSVPDDGMIQINHNENTDDGLPEDANAPSTNTNEEALPPSDLAQTPEATDTTPNNLSPGPKLMTEPPTLGGTLTANTDQENLDPSTDPLGLPTAETPQILDRTTGPFGGPPTAPDMSAAISSDPDIASPAMPLPAPASTVSPSPVPAPSFTPPPQSWTPPPASTPSPPIDQSIPDDKPTLADLEESVDSPHVKSESVNEARDEVDKALTGNASTTMPPEPIQALNAQQIGGDLHPAINSNSSAASQTSDQGSPTTGSAPQVIDPTAPPPVPPPIPFQFGSPSTPQT
jgi:nanoRNase/pAp phosphatase (c-di-AMP/oligoRNAs hydrolase)